MHTKTIHTSEFYSYIKYYINLNTLNPKVAFKNVVIHIFIILDKEDIIYIIGDPMVSYNKNQCVIRQLMVI